MAWVRFSQLLWSVKLTDNWCYLLFAMILLKAKIIIQFNLLGIVFIELFLFYTILHKVNNLQWLRREHLTILFWFRPFRVWIMKDVSRHSKSFRWTFLKFCLEHLLKHKLFGSDQNFNWITSCYAQYFSQIFDRFSLCQFDINIQIKFIRGPFEAIVKSSCEKIIVWQHCTTG